MSIVQLQLSLRHEIVCMSNKRDVTVVLRDANIKNVAIAVDSKVNRQYTWTVDELLQERTEAVKDVSLEASLIRWWGRRPQEALQDSAIAFTSRLDDGNEAEVDRSK